MRIIIPYTESLLHPLTKQWGERVGAIFARINEEDNAGYFDLLADLWRFPVDTLLVEHDIYPPERWWRLLCCSREWCVSPYSIGADVANRTPMLGCAYFAATLMYHEPNLLDEVGCICDDGMPPKHWKRLDTRVARVLTERGHRPHFHAEAMHCTSLTPRLRSRYNRLKGDPVCG